MAHDNDWDMPDVVLEQQIERNRENKEKPMTNEIPKTLIEAMVKLQSELQPAIKNKENPFFKSSYADLTGVWEVCRDLLVKNGLAVIQTTEVREGRNLLKTTLAHISGQEIHGELLLNPVKDDPQALGSAITYARRYTLAAILGIVTEEDDDGNAASKPTPPVAKSASTSSRSEGSITCPFGKYKGKPYTVISANELAELVKYFQKQIDNPEKTKWLEGNKAHLAAVKEALVLAEKDVEYVEAKGA